MALTMKYGPVLEMCNRFNMKDAKVEEKAEGYLKVYGIVHTQYQKMIRRLLDEYAAHQA